MISNTFQIQIILCFILLNHIAYSMVISQSIFLSGIQDIMPNYDYYIIDQWGVLHNGLVAYSNKIVECLVNLKNNNKKLIMLSNSSKRKDASYKGLEKVGIDPLLFDSIITSGELGWNRINNREFQFQKIKKFQNIRDNNEKLKIFVFGNGIDDEEYIESCNCQLAAPKDADLILSRGTFSILDGSNNKLYNDADEFMNNINSYLSECMKYQIPMLVTNPDFYRPGSNSPMPGLVGNQYKSMNPSLEIEYIGKPYSLVYETCLDVLTQQLKTSSSIVNNQNTNNIMKFRNDLIIDRNRICCIGDSMEHDIEGATRSSMHSLFITNGVHSNEYHTIEGSFELPNNILLNEFLNKHLHTTPTYMIPNFQW